MSEQAGFHRRTYLLGFDDPSFNGLEVRCRGASLDQAMELQRLLIIGAEIADDKHDVDRRSWFELLAGLVVEWNLLDEQNEPVALDAKTIGREEFSLLRAITTSYLMAAVMPPGPLSQPSSDGSSSLEGYEIPMEPLSENPTN